MDEVRTHVRQSGEGKLRVANPGYLEDRCPAQAPQAPQPA